MLHGFVKTDIPSPNSAIRIPTYHTVQQGSPLQGPARNHFAARYGDLRKSVGSLCSQRRL